MTEQIKSIQEKVVPILRRADVMRSSLFGSYVRGEETPESDVDILIEFGGKKNLLDLVDLKEKLEHVLDREVDLITYKSITPRLKHFIEQEEIPIFTVA